MRKHKTQTTKNKLSFLLTFNEHIHHSNQSFRGLLDVSKHYTFRAL